MFTNFRRLRDIVTEIGISISEKTREIRSRLEEGIVSESGESIIKCCSGLYEILPDGSVVRLVIHIPQGPTGGRGKRTTDLDDPVSGWHKYHLVGCNTVNEWRYRMRKAYRPDGTFVYPVFHNGGKEYKPELRKGGRRLHLCQNCHRILLEKGYSGDYRNFDVASFLSSSILPQGFDDVAFVLEKDYLANEYPADWNKISSEYKKSKDWKCESCHLSLADNRSFLHCHHIDEVKSNISVFNLKSLCIRCHSKVHPNNSMLSNSPDLRRFNQLFPVSASESSEG